MVTVSRARRRAQHPHHEPDQLALFPPTITECDLCGVADGPLVEMLSIVNGGVVVGHRECGAHRGYAVVHTSPIPSILAPLVDGAAGSTVAQPSRRDAVGAVEADGTEQDSGQGRGDGEPAAEDEADSVEVDPDDTSRCPCSSSCDACGYGGRRLDVAIVETPVGIACITLCPGCVDAGRLPRLSAGAAVRRVMAHAGHLGCTVDDLAGGAR